MSAGDFTVDFDLTVFRAMVKGLTKIAQDNLGSILRANNGAFVRKCQVYLARQMDIALRDYGGLSEGERASVRGQPWAGWAIQKSHGGSPPESTRYYFRKYSRKESGKLLSGLGGLIGVVAYRTYKAWLGMVAARPWEKVWAKRASGKPYSSSSKLMQDTGRMRAALILMDTTVNGNNIELMPGSGMPKYFTYQNQMRPLWVIEHSVDDPIIAGYAQDTLADILLPLTGGA
jgi:hypothetical protein